MLFASGSVAELAAGLGNSCGASAANAVGGMASTASAETTIVHRRDRFISTSSSVMIAASILAGTAGRSKANDALLQIRCISDGSMADAGHSGKVTVSI